MSEDLRVGSVRFGPAFREDDLGIHHISGRERPRRAAKDYSGLIARLEARLNTHGVEGATNRGLMREALAALKELTR